MGLAFHFPFLFFLFRKLSKKLEKQRPHSSFALLVHEVRPQLQHRAEATAPEVHLPILIISKLKSCLEAKLLKLSPAIHSAAYRHLQSHQKITPNANNPSRGMECIAEI